MPLSNFDLEWWKLACEYNPDPVAFVNLDNTFIYCNTAWCSLVGWSESELREKTWMDITKMNDIGGDTAEVEKIKSGEKSEYYLEKSYLRKDHTEISVSLYVHRYPEYGVLEGFIVFARRLSSKEYEDLRFKFLELSKMVLILQQGTIASTAIMAKMNVLENDLSFTKDFLKSMMNKSNINIGDNVGGDNTGRDKINNQSILMITISVISGIVVLGFLTLVLGGYLKLQHDKDTLEVGPKTELRQEVK